MLKTSINFLSTPNKVSVASRTLAIISLLAAVSGCSNWLPTSGPSVNDVQAAAAADPSFIELVDINAAVAQRIQNSEKKYLFAESFPSTGSLSYDVRPGDVISVSIWEASPPMLFGSTPSFSGGGSFPGVTISGGGASMPSKANSLPDQMVDKGGYVTIPFAGRIKVSGKSIPVIEQEIVNSLKGKANYPQVIVQFSRNATNYVTVVGEVSQSVVMPLTPRGERLLDAIASAGGVKQPVNKTTLQLSRGPVTRSMSLERVIQDPNQNIRLNPGDVVTAFFQPFSFTALGATGKNDEVTFEGQGISLSQALGRVGGLQDNRSDVKGVFVFRFEDPSALEKGLKPKAVDQQGRVPVVYRLDMSDPSSFFAAQGFMVKNKDLIYVANAGAVEFGKFLNILVAMIYPIVNAGNIKVIY